MSLRIVYVKGGGVPAKNSVLLANIDLVFMANS
jgi:hypothetical protein